MYTIEMKFYQRPLVHYSAFIASYLLLSLLLPANKIAMKNYGLTSLHYHVLLLLVVLPFIGIWFAAFYGFTRLSQYATSIRAANEGADFHRLAVGSGWLTYALPITALVSIILNNIANAHPGFHPPAVIIEGYLSLFLPLIGFTILSTSARKLSARSNLRVTLAAGRGLILIFVSLGVLYCYVAFHNLGTMSLTSTNNAYFLPVWLMVTTMIMPYLYAWFIGLLAAYELILLAKQSKGVIYRQGLRFVGYGIAIVIVSSIAVQYMSSILPRTGSLHLNFVLVYVFVIELLMAGGYSFIALGARRLQRIEEV